MTTFPTLYKRDTKGKVRIWFMEIDGDRYRTTSGLEDGQKVTTEWTTVEAKNVGRSNATTPEQQAIAEVKSHYQKKLDVDYYEKVEDIDTPKIFKPMLAKKWEDRKGKIDWNRGVWVQPKLDGIRCIVSRHGAFSRTGKPIVAIPHILDLLAPVFDDYPDAIFDGELYNHTLAHDFNAIVSMVRKQKLTALDITTAMEKVQYHIYDLPSMMYELFTERYKYMTHFIHEYGMAFDVEKEMWPSAIQLVPTRFANKEEEVDAIYAGYIEDGYEGGIIRLDEPYEQKRSSNLLKRKDFDDNEFEIVAIEEGSGNWSGYAKVVVFKNPDGSLNRASIQGSQDYCRHVLENAQAYIGKQATIQYFNITPDGAPRFPVAKVLHDDKRW